MSEYRFACTSCGQHLTALPGHAGMLIKCPACQAEFRIPPPPGPAAGLPLGAPPPMASAPPPIAGVVPPLRPQAPPSRSSNRGLIIGLVVGACVLVMLGMFAVGAIFFVRAVKHEVRQQQSMTPVLPPTVQTEEPSTSPPMVKDQQVATDPATVEIPDTPVSGTLQGTGFTLTQAKLELAGKMLKLSEGAGFIPDKQFLIFLFNAGNSPLEGKVILVPDPDQTGYQPRPHIHLRWKEGNTSKSAVLMENYTLRLEFNNKTGNDLTGKIYLEAPERFNTKIEGTFKAEAK
jgi:hypothetical protein